MAAMNEHSDIEGASYAFEGADVDEKGESIETEEFSLSKGALVAYFEHQGAGPFTVSPKRVNTGFLGGLTDTVLFEGEGPVETIDGWLVKDSWLADLKPGSHKLEIIATGPWACELFQPDLGQPSTEFPVQYGGSAGDIIAGIFRVGSRPLLFKARHDGIGQFVVKRISLDGVDEGELTEEGQIHFEDRPSKALPGKEYLVLVKADGDWELEFSEGY